MNKKEIKKFVQDTLVKGYDRSDVEDLLNSWIEEGKVSKEDALLLIDAYDEEFAEVEKTKLGFFEKRRLKKALKKVREMVTTVSAQIQELTQQTKALNKKEKKKLEELKEQMIVAIIGNLDKGEEGLINVFDVTDEKTGEPITRKALEGYEINEIEELLTELLDALDKEI